MPKLENWFVTAQLPSCYAAPEQRRTVLCGIVFGHKDIGDNNAITTSELLFLNTGKRIAITKNTTYELGEPDPDWVQYLKNCGHSLSDFDFDRLEFVGC